MRRWIRYAWVRCKAAWWRHTVMRALAGDAEACRLFAEPASMAGVPLDVQLACQLAFLRAYSRRTGASGEEGRHEIADAFMAEMESAIESYRPVKAK